jgi:hypothetical protein
MRQRHVLVSFLVLAPALGTAHIAPAAPARPPPAQPRPAPAAPQLPRIDLAAVPEPCRPLAKQAVAPNVSAALTARIALAGCMADRAIAPLALCDCAASIVEVDAAAAPALAVLDDAISAADPANQVLGEHAEGQLYLGFATRLLATLPRLEPGATAADTALRDMRKQTLEAQLAPWREAAMASFQHVVDAAKAHPELATNPAVTAAVRDSQQRLAAETADRPAPTAS